MFLGQNLDKKTCKNKQFLNEISVEINIGTPIAYPSINLYLI
jgi:hypothetical protein